MRCIRVRPCLSLALISFRVSVVLDKACLSAGEKENERDDFRRCLEKAVGEP